MRTPGSHNAIKLAVLWFALAALPVISSSAEIRGKKINDSSSSARKMPPSSEKGLSAPGRSGDGSDAIVRQDDIRSLCEPADVPDKSSPFKITIDGQPVSGGVKRNAADRQRCVDVALEKAEIQIHFDPLQSSPALNVWVPKGVARGGTVRFFTYTNYALWLRNAELRIFEKGQDTKQQPYAVVPVQINSQAEWQPPVNAPDELFYLMRVYDDKNRFDETTTRQLYFVSESSIQRGSDRRERKELSGWGDDTRKVSNIPVRGGTVTINGQNIQKGESVWAFGFPVPVDSEGKFAFRQIVSPGPRTLEISVRDDQGREKVFRRNISIADRDWFYIGVADLTMGGNSVVGPAKLVTDDTSHYNDKEYIDGRGAFYLKGLIKGDYLLTASADTRERPIKDLFSNFDSKDPYYLLRRLDPDKLYPVYGDDSTVVDDSPTQGKFYVRLERGDSQIMWGNFQTYWTGTELTQYSRGLYGANLLLSSGSTTAHGEKQVILNTFAAEPGTLGSREEFRGTGGSLYYLRHMDITQGSERLWIEIRDKDSEIAIERRQLTPEEDYSINYIQGRIMLRAPLPSTADGSTLVLTSSIDGNPVYLIATYEYAPGFDKLTSLATGAQTGLWITNHFRFGGTIYRQGEDQEKQELQGFDVTARYRPGTFVKAEIARSDGSGNGALLSNSGGFNFNQITSAGDKASAWRLEGTMDFSEIWKEGKGKASFYWRDKDRGFSAPGQINYTGEAVSQAGFAAQIPMGKAQLNAKTDRTDSDSQNKTSAEASFKRSLGTEFALSAGVRFDNRKVSVPNASAILSRNGSRTDAIVRMDYRPLAEPQKESKKGAAAPVVYRPYGFYGYLQGTLARTEDRNRYDRAGLGAGWQATDNFKLGLEGSGGYGGLGGKISGDYRIDDRSSVYLSYSIETEIPDNNPLGSKGTGILGSKYKLSDRLGIFGETRFINGYSSGLTHSFGLDLAPTDRWTYGFKFETGVLSDAVAGDMRRTAVGLSTAYAFQKTKFANALEYRKDSGSTEDRETWLARNSVGYQIDPSWRLLGKLNFSVSNSSVRSYNDANFVEGVFGAAFRPVKNDRWNALLKYTYFYDLPSPGQIMASSYVPDYQQKSHVIDLDVIYDLVPWLSAGGKYGLRYGELRPSRTEGDWFSSRAQLFIARADLHLVRRWDALVEARQLSAAEAHDTRSGFLVGIFRHINDNFKVGVGYNFTDFSDNLSNLSSRSRGVFLNILGTM